MIAYIKSLAKSGSIRAVGLYTFSNFFTKSISFASLPLFTYLLSQKDFGIISLFSSAITFLMPFISLGLLYSTSTDFFRLDKKHFSEFITSTFFLPIGITTLLIVVLYLAFPYLEANFAFDPIFIWMIPLIGYFNFLYEQNLIILRNTNKPKYFLWVNIVKSILEIGIAVLLISIFYLGWLGRIWGIFIAFLCTGLFAFRYLVINRYFSRDIEFSIVKKELVYSVPVIVIQFGIFCLSASDRFFINYYYGEERTGVYSLAATFASVILILGAAILQYLFPRIYQELKNNPNASGEIRRLFRRYTKMILLAIIGIIFFSILSYYTIIHPKFREGAKYFFFLAIGNTLWCIAYFFYSFLMYYKAKRKILFIGLSSILINVTSNFFFIKENAEWGAVLSNICSYFTVLVIAFVLSKNYFYKVSDESPN